jgi:hypothetical protein
MVLKFKPSYESLLEVFDREYS